MDIEPLIRKISDELESRREEMMQLLVRLVETESPSDDFGAVNRFSAMLVREMEAMGLKAEMRAVRSCPDLLECFHGRGERPVMLIGHLDTVWPVGTLAKMPVRIDGDLLYGPGSYDMKAGIVVGLFALAALADECPRVNLFLTPQEEVGGEQYRQMLEQRARESRAVIGLEPAWPGGAVKTERKGSGHISIKAVGRAAHAGADLEKGVNAIVEIADQIAALRRLQPSLGDGVTLNIGIIRGGTRPNVVPDSAEIDVDLRFKRQIDGEDALRRVRDLRPVLSGASIEISGAITAPPLERTDRVMRLFELAGRVESLLGRRLEEASTGGVSEVSYAAATGVPAIDGFGADGDGAHAAHEHVTLPSLAKRAALLAGTLLMLGRDA
ncbi:MAG: M20 family metallopeptidase [Acidobacteria bacterium]|nr:M20 family metallopeptidase [Acidobacteriota bacterium]